MKIAQKHVKILKSQSTEHQKNLLYDQLNQMEHAVAQRKYLSLDLDEAALRIQRSARKMISRIHFRTSLFKLICFQNILETKIHKDKMKMLWGFEQMIINTEVALEKSNENDEEE